MSGFYLMSRGWMDHPALVGREPFSRREAWVWMIEQACASSIIGEFCMPIPSLAKRWQWDTAKATRFLKRLVREGMISLRADRLRATVTINDFDARGAIPRVSHRLPQRIIPVAARRKPSAGRIYGASWFALRRQAFERDGWACVYCTSTERLECDHVVPVSRGGGNDLGNLATACRRCNRSKHAKTPAEWIAVK